MLLLLGSLPANAFFFQQADTLSRPRADTVQQDTTKKSRLLPLYMRDRYGDPFSQFRSPSPLLLSQPNSLKFNISLDTTRQFYNLSESLGGFDYRPQSQMPFNLYRDMRYQQQTREYWKNISAKQDGADDLGGQDLAIPPIKLGKFAQRLFGGDEITIQPNGSVVLDFGGLWQRVDNPSLPIRQQRNGGFNFDQQISMSMQGKIGEKLGVNANFDTKNTFQFEQLYNINYTAFEEDIIQEVQLGNVSFPVRNSLITGAQNLFGVTTKMRFGKLWISTALANQRGSTESITIRNGAQAREVLIRADSYDYNRHFFLAQFFRENYERSLRSLPVITSNVVVTRVEVYVTNRNNNTQTLRNILSFMDLGEGRPFRGNLAPAPKLDNAAANDANGLFARLRSVGDLRVADNASRAVETNFGFVKGTDFEILRGARRLDEREFTFHPQLGYISLVTPLRNDEILAVSFEYTYNGQVYRVGELTEDYQNFGEQDVIFMKLLSPSTIRIDLPTWDLMMKNIYPLNANQITKDNFQMRVIYRDDLTGIDNPSLHEGVRTKDIPLVQLFGADKLNMNNDPQPDGNFDYIEGITVDSRYGRVIFPVLEPFGRTLESYFLPPEELQLVNKYVFDTLYRGTQADAALNTTLNKFFLKGSYQSASGGEIVLPGINIAPNSVVVRAGGITLTEGVDYTVDYQFGRVRILNEGVLSSGKEIKIQYERADLFSVRQRNFMGVDAEYRLTKDIKFTGTLLHLNERPLLTRESIGNEPVRNTIWGLGGEYRSESRLLTKLVDKLPLLSTKENSTISFKGEFAQLIPGQPKLLGQQGNYYIDDFEQAEISYDFSRNPVSWVLGSTPQFILDRFPETDNPLSYNYKRAKLAWYNIDNAFYFPGGTARSRPANVTDEQLENNYVRGIEFNEVFPGRQRAQVNAFETSFDLAYFPTERGPYNYTTELNADGTLRNPEQNFGAITRAITQDIDFDNINVQYMEFWLMDPFISGRNGRRITGAQDNTGGQLYLNLGNVSEDVIPDERHFFENGLPLEDPNKVAETPYGKVPTEQYLTNAFDVGPNARQLQDVGFDGLRNEEETPFFQNFLTGLPSNLNAQARQQITEDPSADNFRYYLDPVYDADGITIVDRYKAFNGTESNSPENTGGLFTPSSSTIPDNEDLNRDNTVSDLEQYYQYRVDMFPGMNVNNHPFIVDELEGLTDEATGQRVKWYLFRIPLRGNHAQNINGINGFKSIRFFRMFMTGWRDPVILRMVQFQMVGAQWRPFLETLNSPEPQPLPDNDQTAVDVSTVNIEENGQDAGIAGRVPYNLPPGFIRDFDVTSAVTRRQNEQSIQLCLEDLQDGDARAIYKNYSLDVVFYKNLKLEIHAHGEGLNDNQLTAFIRLGTDFKDNYYEIEVPLRVTPLNTPSSDRDGLWPRENEISLAIEELIKVKAQRNADGAFIGSPYPDPVARPGANVGRYRVTVVGNPDLSSVQTIMLGVRNPRSADRLPKDVCVWFNELRMTEFTQQSGWAANAALNLKLADLATINGSVRYSTVGFGGIQDRVSERSRTENLDYDISANINLDKFLFGKLGISLPLFVSYEKQTSRPYFNPLDPDTPLTLSLEKFANDATRNDFRSKVVDMTVRRSINLTNVRKKKLNSEAKTHLWDIENLALSASYSDAFTRNITTESLQLQQWKLGAVYGYTTQAQPFEPFKEAGGVLGSPWMKWLKEFNLSLLPSSISVRGDLNRLFRSTQLRNRDLTTIGIPTQFEKAFTFTRGYNLNWALSRNLGLDYQANAYAIVDEPFGAIDTEAKRDSIRNNLRRLGRMKTFSQTIGANYRLPLDKFPLTTWLGADARYSSTVDWAAGAVGIADTLGNTIRNTNTLNVNGKIDLVKVYSLVPFLKKMNSPPRRGAQPDDPLTLRKAKLEKRLLALEARFQNRLDQQVNKEQEAMKREQERQAKEQEKAAKQAAKNPPALDSLGNPIATTPPQPEPVQPAEIEEDTAKKVSALEKKIQRVKGQVAEVDAEIAKRKEEERKPAELKALKGIAGLITSVKNINLSYTENNSTTLPGYRPVPRFLGFDQAWQAPGVPFILGSQDPGIRFRAAENGWLSNSFFQNNPFLQNTSKQLSIRANAEPIRDFKIQLEAKQSATGSYSEIFRFVPAQQQFQSQTPVRSGTYGISIFTLNTAFKPFDATNNSEVFDQFVANREIVKARLEAQNPAGEYPLQSQDVLIAAFRAAYTGQDANEADLTAFPRLPIPGWQVTYNGLSRLGIFKEAFRSISITHGYSSNYSIGSYTSSLFYNDRPDLLELGFDPWEIGNPVADTAGNIVPILVLNQVTISEQFSPLIGVNVRTTGNMTIKLDFKRRRDLALNLSNAQVTELRSNDITGDIGYTKAGMKIPFRMRGVYKTLENDVNFRMAFSVRDTRTIQRKVNEDPTVTAGNINIQFRPTVAYQINKQTNLQFYFERSINNPLVSSSFRRATTAFGIQLRYALTE